MKVKELIAKLQEFDGELEILINSYEEGGCETPSSIKEIGIMLDSSNESDSYLIHWEIQDWMTEGDYLHKFIEEGGKVSTGVIIRR